MSNVFAVSNNTSLKDLKDKLAKDEATLNNVIKNHNCAGEDIKTNLYIISFKLYL